MNRPRYGHGAVIFLVRQYLSEHPDSRDPEIAAALDIRRQSSNRVLRGLLRDGAVTQDIYGRYRLKDEEPAAAIVP
jgi:DNA-binding IclR family transcriptional regulator